MSTARVASCESLMADAEIAGKADFDHIRYAQAWEDADLLTQALGPCAGGMLVSICAAGDNTLALLTLDPARVVALDISRAQIECLNLRIGAYRHLGHDEFLELMGARQSDRRPLLLARALASRADETKRFWLEKEDAVVRHGAAGVGKFERYFRLFGRYLLPLVHSRQTIDAVFEPRSQEARQRFLDRRFNTVRWRLLMKLFFSRFTMARLGRDKAFFAHVEGSVADHVARRIRYAVVSCDPSKNPYLHWILKGSHAAALPFSWRVENYEVIRSRLDRLDIRQGSLESFVEGGERADGFNLSDIFEYMSEQSFAQTYGRLLDSANPGARFVYWNMMAPRRVLDCHAQRVRTCTAEETRLKAMDKAFFYSDFVVEEVL
jgi:S-adenosylmethionine-diacylglycerol 3-amino-3-carboxypropyl transferase